MSIYKTQLDTLKDSFSSALENFYNTFIIHHTNPDSVEYSQIYSQEKGQLSAIHGSLFTLQNSIQQSTDSLNKQISLLDERVKIEKDKNENLHKRVRDKKGAALGSIEMIIESQESYDYQHLKNVTLFVGDIILLYFIYSIAFAKKN
uniref:Uncharacterized protein n=1 Tax=viral metagenome TaxID=1070528 RepID=A0A6C0BAT5_9ZZZZ